LSIAEITLERLDRILLSRKTFGSTSGEEARRNEVVYWLPAVEKLRIRVDIVDDGKEAIVARTCILLPRTFGVQVF
jgi:hypothetical protein